MIGRMWWREKPLEHDDAFPESGVISWEKEKENKHDEFNKKKNRNEGEWGRGPKHIIGLEAAQDIGFWA